MRQHGVVEHSQLLRIGLGRGAIAWRVRHGRLHRVYRGVYSLSPPSLLSVRGRWMAATLSFGAVLSHRDGGRLWSILRTAGSWIDVTVAGASRRSRDGIRVHRVRHLDPRDWGHIEGIPVTSLARTLLDLAEVLPPRQLERAIEEAERLRVLDMSAIDELLARSPGRRGRRALAEAVGEVHPEATHGKSDLEALFIALCREAGLPAPAINVVVEGYEVDAHWPGTPVIVELDSWDFHRTRAAFERDRARDLALKKAEYVVVRLTWRQLTRDRAEVTTTLRALLGSARTPRAHGPGALARALP